MTPKYESIKKFVGSGPEKPWCEKNKIIPEASTEDTAIHARPKSLQ